MYDEHLNEAAAKMLDENESANDEAAIEAIVVAEKEVAFSSHFDALCTMVDQMGDDLKYLRVKRDTCRRCE